MSLNRWATRRDGSERPILDALDAVGALYLLLDVFDVLVWFRGRLTMLDCKTGKRKATTRQLLMVAAGWPLYFVRTPEEALQAIGVAHGRPKAVGRPKG